MLASMAKQPSTSACKYLGSFTHIEPTNELGEADADCAPDLLKQGHVLYAFPARAWHAREPSRICKMDNNGKFTAMSWLRNLQGSRYTELPVLGVGKGRRTFCTNGLGEEDELWFPTSKDYGDAIDENVFDELSASGFGVTIQQFETQTDLLNAAEAALSAVFGGDEASPCIFATFVVRPSVLAIVHQPHAFTMSCILARLSCEADKPPETSACTRELLVRSTMQTARKLRDLARQGTFKLNTLPESVVFVPTLALDESNDTWNLKTEFTLETDGICYSGEPRLVDFGGDFVISGDKSCARAGYVASVLMLLAFAKGIYGEAYRPMLYALTGRSANGDVLSRDQLPCDFDSISIIDALNTPCGDSEFINLINSKAAQAPSSYEALHQVGRQVASVFDQCHHVFQKAVQYQLSSWPIDTAIFAPASAHATENACLDAIVRRRLSVVLTERCLATAGVVT